MEILRTPDERFSGLEGYDFTPHYVEVEGLRIHAVDEGPQTGPTILLMHGEPSWSYLYRTMIPPLVANGYRCVAPDLVGFGRSDKPAHRDDYTYQRHVDWMRGFIEALELDDVTLFCQDWGGLIGLRLIAEQPSRFARVVASNTFLPTGNEPLPEAFFAWQRFSQTTPHFDVGEIIARGCAQPLSPAARAGYDAPFPDERYKAGARAFPSLVPSSPEDPAAGPNREAWLELMRFDKPFLTAFGDSDPITLGAERFLQAAIPGCKGQPHTVVEGAGHFCQEDRGEKLAAIVASFIDPR